MNATVTSFEQAAVDGPDVISAIAIFLMRCLKAAGKSTDLLGRSLDLAAALQTIGYSRRFSEAFLLIGLVTAKQKRPNCSAKLHGPLDREQR